MARQRFALVLICLFTVGCGGPKTPEEKQDSAKKDPLVQALHATGVAYTNHIDAHGKGPAGWDEFLAFAKSSNGLDAQAIETIRSKGYTLKWGASYKNATEGVTRFVLAQPSGAGPKLMLDGTIKLD